MLKKNKIFLMITSLIILLPMLFGLLVWDELPARLATHWGIDNQPDGYSSRAMAVFGIPLILLGMHWFCLLMMEIDIKKKNHTPKMINLVLCIVPFVSILAMTMTYAYALGLELDVGLWVLMLLGILFIVIGNYLPKCRQNWTIGIKLPWTLSDPDNWNHTHRMAGPLWMAGGFLIILCSFFSTNTIVVIAIFAVIFLMVIIPSVYSYLYYKKHNSEE